LRAPWPRAASLAAVCWLVIAGCASTRTDPAAESHTAALRSELAEREAEIKSLKADLALAQKRIVELSAGLDRTQRQIDENQRRLQESMRSQSAINRQADDYRQRLLAAENAYRRLQIVSTELANLRSQFAAVQLEYQAEIARLEKAVAELKAQLGQKPNPK